MVKSQKNINHYFFNKNLKFILFRNMQEAIAENSHFIFQMSYFEEKTTTQMKNKCQFEIIKRFTIVTIV